MIAVPDAKRSPQEGDMTVMTDPENIFPRAKPAHFDAWISELDAPVAKKSRMPLIILGVAAAWLATWAATIWFWIPLMLSICTGGANG